MSHTEILRPLVDQVQVRLVDAYQLQDLDLDQASDYLWPDRTSKSTEKAIADEVESGVFNAFMTTDNIPVRMSLLQKIKFSPLVRRKFKHHHPVIYYAPSLSQRLENTTDIDQLINEAQLPDFLMLAEEVGHFVYRQSQLILHRQPAGPLMPEAMALLDYYQIIKPNHTDLTIGYIDKRKEQLRKWSDNPMFSYYSDAISVIEGLLDHIIRQESSGQDTSSSTANFYRLSGPEKIKSLRALYKELWEKVDPSYEIDFSVVNSIVYDHLINSGHNF